MYKELKTAEEKRPIQFSLRFDVSEGFISVTYVLSNDWWKSKE